MMDWTTRRSTMEDAAFIFDNLWERGAEELACYGETRETWLRKFELMILLSCSVTFIHRGSVVAILGVDKIGDGAGYTWFQATREAEAVLLGLTRHMRKQIAALAKLGCVQEAILQSLCVSPAAPRWYECLGFKEQAQGTGKMYAGRIERRFTQSWEENHVR